MCIFCFACAVAESKIFALYPLFNILRENVKRCEEMFKLCIEKSGTHIGCGSVAGLWVRRLKRRGRELSPTCSSTFRVPPRRLNAPSSVGLGCESNTGWSPGVRLLFFFLLLFCFFRSLFSRGKARLSSRQSPPMAVCALSSGRRVPGPRPVPSKAGSQRASKCLLNECRSVASQTRSLNG